MIAAILVVAAITVVSLPFVAMLVVSQFALGRIEPVALRIARWM